MRYLAEQVDLGRLLERWAPWVAIGGGGFLVLCGLVLISAGRALIADADQQGRDTIEDARATLALVDQCATQNALVLSVMQGPWIPKVVVPGKELPQFARGGP